MMEKTIKSMNIVAVALLIVNLCVELWECFRHLTWRAWKKHCGHYQKKIVTAFFFCFLNADGMIKTRVI